MEGEESDDADFPFNILAQEAKDLYLTQSIERIAAPSPLQFYRDYIAPNKPVIITDGLDTFPVVFSNYLPYYLPVLLCSGRE